MVRFVPGLIGFHNWVGRVAKSLCFLGWSSTYILSFPEALHKHHANSRFKKEHECHGKLQSFKSQPTYCGFAVRLMVEDTAESSVFTNESNSSLAACSATTSAS
ncbi:hypothetical protein GOP47_0030668 [Adiantum capillus-veneris]|nr:hypothetical protein GOP47_0030668 [Adiantum capillus-veneris]